MLTKMGWRSRLVASAVLAATVATGVHGAEEQPADSKPIMSFEKEGFVLSLVTLHTSAEIRAAQSLMHVNRTMTITASVMDLGQERAFRSVGEFVVTRMLDENGREITLSPRIGRSPHEAPRNPFGFFQGKKSGSGSSRTEFRQEFEKIDRVPVFLRALEGHVDIEYATEVRSIELPVSASEDMVEVVPGFKYRVRSVTGTGRDTRIALEFRIKNTETGFDPGRPPYLLGVEPAVTTTDSRAMPLATNGVVTADGWIGSATFSLKEGPWSLAADAPAMARLHVAVATQSLRIPFSYADLPLLADQP